MFICLYSPFPSPSWIESTAGSNVKKQCMMNREVLTAIAAGQVMIRSPVMESGGLLAPPIRRRR